ncbi:MAG: NHL repeat-containing protein [Myxococcales bacterium]
MKRREFLELAVLGGASLALAELLPRALRDEKSGVASLGAVPGPAARRAWARRFIGGSGTLYDVVSEGNRVELRAPDGTERGLLRGELNAPVSLAESTDGSLRVLEWGADRVRTYAADGSLGLAFGSTGSGAAELRGPRDLAERADRLVVADTFNHRVQLFDRDGRPQARFGSLGKGAAELNAPSSLAFAPDGLLHVADLGNARIQVFSADGRPQASYGGWGAEEGRLRAPSCIRFDAAGRAWIADPVGGHVHVFDAAGRFVERHRPQGGAPAWLAFFPDGRAHISLHS